MVRKREEYINVMHLHICALMKVKSASAKMVSCTLDSNTTPGRKQHQTPIASSRCSNGPISREKLLFEAGSLHVTGESLGTQLQDNPSNAGVSHGNSFLHSILLLKDKKKLNQNAQLVNISTMVNTKMELLFLTSKEWSPLVNTQESTTKVQKHVATKLLLESQTHYQEFKSNASVIDMITITLHNMNKTRVSGKLKKKLRTLKNRLKFKKKR